MAEADLIIEVQGGAVTAVHTNLDVSIAVNDHDEGVEGGAVAVIPLHYGHGQETSSTRAEQGAPKQLVVRTREDRRHLKGLVFARGWVDVASTSGGREWLLWIGPLLRARIVTAGETDAYHASLETLTYHDAAEFTGLSEAMSWCEQQVADVLVETRAVLKLSRTPGVCNRLFGRRLL